MGGKANLGGVLLQKALAAACTPIRRCYLDAYMPSQLSRVHDARLSADPLLCAAQMPNGLESGSGWRL
eukprot:2632145-Rhodomonas_salina.1